MHRLRLLVVLCFLFLAENSVPQFSTLVSADSGAAQSPFAMPRADTPLQVDAGGNHTCGIKTDGTLDCWGSNQWGQLNAPAGTFKSVSTGEAHSCAIRSDDTLVCWGDNSVGQLGVPGGTFLQIAAGNFHTCAMKPNQQVDCWGWNNKGQSSVPPGTFYSSLTAGYDFTCGISLNLSGGVECWGDGTSGKTTPPAGTFKGISANSNHTCGIKTDDTVVCWGYNAVGESNAPTGQFFNVGAGYDHTCGVKIDSSIVCWGLNTSGQSSPPDELFSRVSGGRKHTCGVKSDGTLVCWGDNGAGQAAIPVPVVSLVAPNTLLIKEGEVTSLTLNLSTRSFQNVIFNFALSGSAGYTSDYVLTPGTSTTIGIEATSGTVGLAAIDDSFQEALETIIIDLDSVIHGTEAVPQQVSLTIAANDAPPVNLIQNSGFEAQAGGLPDISPWTVKQGSGDKLKCKPENAHSGNCMFVFKGSEGENSALQQTVTPTGITFSTEDTLDLSVFVNGKSGAVGKVKLKISYSDGTPADKFSQDFPTTGVYTEVSRRLALNSSNVDKIKLQLKHQSLTAKVYIDDVSLLHRIGGARLSTLALP